MEWLELKDFLDTKVLKYNQPDYINSDPIQIPHRFSVKEDIEISAFFAAIFAWGNRKMIINKTNLLIRLMDESPFDFIINHQKKDLKNFENFKHRTFNAADVIYFIQALQHIYLNYNGLERVLNIHDTEKNSFEAIERFKRMFFELPHLHRTEKHISSPAKGSAAKRINMYLRWMVRQDNKMVDFGLWKSNSMAKLSCPLDVHSGRVARKLGLLNRKQDDWKSVLELNNQLQKMDVIDPSKYDYALFGLGVFEQF